ncbi:hypothetical protein JKP88DRAFT_254602 [Tribonema minus]|uniref:Uncharacterized protein n=1 Tax=Tribonema minus TaxID=303371 RepID=A0A836CGT3_9STRA|nr:hypothetical protein JKP88DRAFT_254602 [Tribonema minus]
MRVRRCIRQWIEICSYIAQHSTADAIDVVATRRSFSAARPRHAALQLCLGWDCHAPAACALRYRHLHPQDIALCAATASGVAASRGASEGALGALDRALAALEAQEGAPELASARAAEGIVGTAAKTPVKSVLAFEDTLAQAKQEAAAPSASPWAHYRLAIILEGLGLWGSACEAYCTARRGLGGGEGAAALGEWRCRQECAAAMQSLRVGSAPHGSAQQYASVTEDELQQERRLLAQYGYGETPLELLLYCAAAGNCDGESCRGLHVALAEKSRCDGVARRCPGPCRLRRRCCAPLAEYMSLYTTTLRNVTPPSTAARAGPPAARRWRSSAQRLRARPAAARLRRCGGARAVGAGVGSARQACRSSSSAPYAALLRSSSVTLPFLMCSPKSVLFLKCRRRCMQREGAQERTALAFGRAARILMHHTSVKPFDAWPQHPSLRSVVSCWQIKFNVKLMRVTSLRRVTKMSACARRAVQHSYTQSPGKTETASVMKAVFLFAIVAMCLASVMGATTPLPRHRRRALAEGEVAHHGGPPRHLRGADTPAQRDLCYPWGGWYGGWW